MDKVINTIEKHNLFTKNTPLLLMVSGGSDSVALTHILRNIHHGEMAIMHLNHQLRDEADEDEEFVQTLAKTLGLKCFTYKEDIKDCGENIEAYSRKVRYKLANETIKKWYPEAKIVTAHTADDRIENFYMRSIVGTGPGGFSSINYKSNNIVHPLLDVSKDELKQYLIDNNLNWREDVSNLDTDRFRAYVRHKIIPLAKKKNPQLIKNLTNSMNLIAEENEFIDNLVNNIDSIEINKQSALINPAFKNIHPVLQKRAIYNTLKQIFPEDTRINNSSIESIMSAIKKHNYTDNIQCNYAVHSNKSGVLIQPMSDYRKKRNR